MRTPLRLLWSAPFFLAFAACGDDPAATPTPVGGGGSSAGKAGASGAAGTAAAGRAGGGQAGSGQAGSTQGGSGGATAGASSGQGGTGAGQAGAAGSTVGGCTKDADCAAIVATPAGCAIAFCGPASTCAAKARDADGDGHAAADCKPTSGTVTVALGDDCNDQNPAIHPGAWDGPATTGHANACGDAVDQDCSGKADDGSAEGKTCTCTPGDVLPCDEDESGKTITWPKLVGGNPVGACKRGAKTCLAAGTFSACVGAKAPLPESCDGADNDCDGDVDEKGASDERYWLYDGDDDLHAAPAVDPILTCNAPTLAPCGDAAVCPASDPKTGKSHWRVGIPADDCNDAAKSVHPAATEICDGFDNDCNAKVDDAATTATWHFDGDGDGHTLPGGPTKHQCTNPGSDAANCGGGAAPCLGRWTTNPVTQQDCNDADPNLFPGSIAGAACDNGQVGACFLAGTIVCDGPSSTRCSAGLVAPDEAFHDEPKQTSKGPTYNWSCDTKKETECLQYDSEGNCTKVVEHDVDRVEKEYVDYTATPLGATCPTQQAFCEAWKFEVDCKGSAAGPSRKYYACGANPGACGGTLYAVTCGWMNGSCYGGADAGTVVQGCR